MILFRSRWLATALGGFLVWVGTSSGARAALTYDFSLGTRVMTTDNLHLDPEAQTPGQREPVQETVYAVFPWVELDWQEGQDRLTASSRGEYWVFTGDEDQDPMWLPAFTADMEWRRWEPFFLQMDVVRDLVNNTHDQNGEAVIDQSDRTLLTLRTGFTRHLGANGTVEVAYRGELESFTGGGQEDNDRSHRNFGEGVVHYRWSPLLGGNLSVRYGRVEQDLAADYTELRTIAAIDRRLSELFTARGRIEWVRQEEDAFSGGNAGATDAKTRTTVLGGGEIRRELQRGGSWSLAYDDRLATQPDGDTLHVRHGSTNALLRARLGSELGGGVFYETREYWDSDTDETEWGPSLRLRWQIASWVALDLGGDWTETTIRNPGEEEIEEHTTWARSGFVALLGRHFVAEAGYYYRDNNSSDKASEYTANVFYAGLRYQFGVIPPGALPAPSIVGVPLGR